MGTFFVYENVIKQNLVLFVMFWMLVLTASAQQEPSFSHYWAMETSYNPAAAGKESKLNIAGAYAMTLTGFEHAPRTMYIGADMPLMLLNSYHGVGAQLMSDRIGLFDHQRLALQYAYKHRMLGGMLSVGVQVGMLSEKFKGSELDLEEKEDPAFSTTDVSGTALDVSRTIVHSLGLLNSPAGRPGGWKRGGPSPGL